jgi:hypothetical protein
MFWFCLNRNAKVMVIKLIAGVYVCMCGLTRRSDSSFRWRLVSISWMRKLRRGCYKTGMPFEPNPSSSVIALSEYSLARSPELSPKQGWCGVRKGPGWQWSLLHGSPTCLPTCCPLSVLRTGWGSRKSEGGQSVILGVLGLWGIKEAGQSDGESFTGVAPRGEWMGDWVASLTT